MTKFKLISATFALTLSTGAFAAWRTAAPTWRAARTALTAAIIGTRPRAAITSATPCRT